MSRKPGAIQAVIFPLLIPRHKDVYFVHINMIGFGVAISVDSKFAYITGESLVTVDIAGAKVVGRAKFDEGSHGIAISPEGKYAWIAFTLEHRVCCVELSTSEIIACVSVNLYPTSVAISGDGNKVAVGTGIYHTLSIIDVPTNTLEKEVGLSSAPYGLSFDKYNKYIYVCVLPGSGVDVVDVNALERVSTIPVGRNPMGIAVLDESRAYVTNSHELELKLSVISLI